MPLVIPLFISCFVIGVGYLYMLDQVRLRLQEGHPAVLDGFARVNARTLATFVWKRGDKALGDPRLSRTVKWARLSCVISLVLWVAYAVAIFVHIRV